MPNQAQISGAGALSRRELTMLRRAAEDAIHAANPRYGPFIAVVANPLMMIALVDMAERQLVSQPPSGSLPVGTNPCETAARGARFRASV